MSNWSDLKNNSRLKNIYDTRIKILRLIRDFFWSLDFVETDTPIAIKYPGQEPYLNPVPVTIHDTRNTTHKMYLRTSPEYALKKILAAGFGKIFELAKCFRDYESFGGNHNTEFTMLEWYRAPGTYQDIMDDTENLFKFVGHKLANPSPTPSPNRGGINGGVVEHNNKQVNIFKKWDRLSMKEVWQKFVRVNLDECLSLDGMSLVAKKKGYNVGAADQYEDIFFKIFLNEIEPYLGNETPIFVYDYPVCMTSLSRLCEHDNRYAERFELYVGGLELANAYGELTDTTEQQRRLEKDRELRAKLGKETWPVDHDFISALLALPAIAQRATAGVALGVDRMVSLFTGAKDLNEVIFGAVKDQIEK